MHLTDPLFAFVSAAGLDAQAIEFSPTYGRLLLYDRLTGVEDGILGLRRTRAHSIVFVYTQYCWVDFKRRWSLAHTARRAERCLERQADNGAVYLESLLRNVNSGDFRDAWSVEFDTSVGNALRETAEGVAFLQDVMVNGTLSRADEAKYWRDNGIARYTLQYHNTFELGVDEKIEISNALGIRSNFTIKKRDYNSRWNEATIWRIYWGLRNDLWAVVNNNTRISGMSLVRNSSRFFETINETMEQVLIEDGDIPSPFTPQDSLLRATLGPFNSIDMHWVMFPPELFELVQTATRIVLHAALVSRESRAAFLDLVQAEDLVILPKSWKDGNWSFAGGSPLCSRGSPVPYVNQLFGFTDSCASPVSEGLIVARMNIAFASLVISMPPDTSIASLCESIVNVNDCIDLFTRANAFVDTYVSPRERKAAREMASVVQRLIIASNVSLMQYGARMRDKTGEYEYALLTQPVLADDDSTGSEWNPIGWLYLYQWARGYREVVSFEGDEGTLTLISAYYNVVSIAPSGSEVLTSASPYLSAAVQYVTLVECVIAALVLAYALGNGFDIAGSNLLGFNRVVGVVWVGRPLLVVRALVAICILSTAAPIMNHESSYWWMVEPSQGLFSSLLTAGEATWLLVVAIDLLLVFTRGRTQIYAPVVSTVVWTTIALLQLIAPTQHQMEVNPRCEFVNLVDGIVCRSGAVLVGSVSRCFVILAIAGGSLVGCYVVVRLLSADRRAERANGLHLPGIAQAMYIQDGWLHNGNWYVDSASALMAGLVTVRIGSIASVLDIKSWTTLTIADEDVDGDKVRVGQRGMGRGLNLNRLKMHAH